MSATRIFRHRASAPPRHTATASSSPWCRAATTSRADAPSDWTRKPAADCGTSKSSPAPASRPLVFYDAIAGGRTRKLMAAMRTGGVMFYLDRETGKPVLPVEERPVTQNAFLHTSPTQPFTAGADRVGPGCVDKAMIPPGFFAGCYIDHIS